MLKKKHVATYRGYRAETLCMLRFFITRFSGCSNLEVPILNDMPIYRQLHESLRAESQASSSHLVPSLKQVPSFSCCGQVKSSRVTRLCQLCRVKSSQVTGYAESSQVESQVCQVEPSHTFLYQVDVNRQYIGIVCGSIIPLQTAALSAH